MATGVRRVRGWPRGWSPCVVALLAAGVAQALAWLANWSPVGTPHPVLTNVAVSCQTHASAMAMLGGFMATMIVIYLSMNEETITADNLWRFHAVPVFLAAFTQCLAASLMYGVLSGQPTLDDPITSPQWVCFTLAGSQYLAAVLLTFTGLELVVAERVADRGLVAIVDGVRLAVLFLGTTWVFGDMLNVLSAAPQRPDGMVLPAALGAAVYAVGVAGWPAHGAARPPRTPLLAAALTTLVLFTVAASLAAALLTWYEPQAFQPRVAPWVAGSLLAIGLFLGVGLHLLHRHLYNYVSFALDEAERHRSDAVRALLESESSGLALPPGARRDAAS